MNFVVVLIISFFIISILGTLLHFTHNWFKEGFLLHIFSALNESTWEHMKLLLLPTLLVVVFQTFAFNGRYANTNSATFVLLFVQLFSVPLIYEPLRIIFKKVHFLVTIAIFQISIVLGLIAEYFVLKHSLLIFNEMVAGILVLVLVFLFGLFTYYQPRFFLFRDPVSGKYGDYTHSK